MNTEIIIPIIVFSVLLFIVITAYKGMELSESLLGTNND